MTDLNLYHVSAPRGLAPLLSAELSDLGISEHRERRNGILFEGSLAEAYRVCLWSRVASRVILNLTTASAASTDEIYAAVREIPWEDHLTPSGSLAVSLQGRGSGIPHSRYGVQRVKDAIVDRFRDRTGRRPSVDRSAPDVRVNVYLRGDEADIGVDLSGEGLHRRGYRRGGTAAPIKENLAAAVLLRAGWPELASAGAPLLDPLCGSGTIPIEAALMAGDTAPGLLRPRHGFDRWRGHDPDSWSELLAEARERREAGIAAVPPIHGSDRDPGAVRVARDCIAAAGLTGRIRIEQQELESVAPPGDGTGLVVANPPYGERLGEEAELAGLYENLGDVLKTRFAGWRVALITGNPELGKRTGLRAKRIHRMWNGAIPCRLLHLEISPEWFVDRARRPASPEVLRAVRSGEPGSPGAEMLANRLKKNLRILSRWARRGGIDCYRLYDSDVPEYAFAVDLYRGEELWAHVQEYEPPRSVDAGVAKARRAEALAAIVDVLEVDPPHVIYKVRRRGGPQYERQSSEGLVVEVREAGLAFLVNLTDYLDTGLFLDHRPTRRLLHDLAEGRNFLNLFGYTGAATVHAAAGGATGTTTVDLSNTYLDWARKNLERNGYTGKEHRLVRADCLRFLESEGQRRYGLIFLDPPSRSVSKGMREPFDVQRDHVSLIRATTRLLEPDGDLVFSTNLRKFRLEHEELPGLVIEDITRKSIPRDFERRQRIHRCFRIRRAP